MSTFYALLVLALAPQSSDVTAQKVAQLPEIDGKAADEAWVKAKEWVIKIDKTGEVEQPRNQMWLRAVHDGASVAFLLVWKDETKHDRHQDFVWKPDDGEYKANDDELEDACSLAFALEGPFNVDMLAGIESKWDVWEWGAYRANAGFAKDRVHIYSKNRPEGVKSKRFSDRNEQVIFLARPDDEGTPCVRKVEEAPAEKKGDKVPQWELQKPTGSCADVQAKGSWADGKWTVEFKRKLNTGHKDDTAFDPAKGVDFAVAVFDQGEKSDHEISPKYVLKFEK
jgi:hypothetical protein